MEELLINGIWLFTYYMVLFTMSYTNKQDMKPNKGKVLYVSLPAWVPEEEEIKSLLGWLSGKNRAVTLFFTAFSLYFYLPLPFKGWVCVVSIFVFIMLYSHYAKITRKKLLMLKRERQWTISGVSESAQFDLRLSTLPRTGITFAHFLIPAALQIVSGFLCIKQKNIPLALSTGFFLLVIILIYAVLRQLPYKTYCEDTAANKLLNDSRIHYTGKFLFLLTLEDALMSLFLSLSLMLESIYSFFLGAGLVMITIILTFLAVESLQKMNRMKENYLEGIKPFRYEEDEFWNYGLFGAYYRNPNDPVILKANNSNGANYNINMGNPRARLLSAAFACLLVLFLSYLFLYPWILDKRHELVEMELQDGSIRISGPFYGKDIPLDTIQEAELMEEMPDGIRTFGSANGIYATGNYRLDGIGNCKMYIASRHRPYILCYTDTGIVIINDDEESRTREVYRQLTELIREKD